MKIYESILNKYGMEHQTRKAMEEMSELIQALNKMIDLPTESHRQAVIEEMADVEITIEQMRIGWKISRSELSDARIRKINRMRKHLQE